MNYTAPWWLPGGNLQTIWPALQARRVSLDPPAYRRERWATPDGDFLDLDWLVDNTGGLTATVATAAATAAATATATAAGPATQQAPLLVLFHGLEGSSRSHYVQGFAGFAKRRGLAFVVPHFRGCSGELNHGPRAYHSQVVYEESVKPTDAHTRRENRKNDRLMMSIQFVLADRAAA